MVTKFCQAVSGRVSLSLAVIIAKFFPAIHNHIVSKATNNFEYQSLYWGSSVVTNVFTYGLWFVAARVGSLYIQYSIFSAFFYYLANLTESHYIYCLLRNVLCMQYSL